MIQVGCCGFPKRHADCYTALDVIEVQKTFYRPPQVKTALRWRAEAPPDFTFTMKAWQLITHEPSSPTYRRLGMEIPPEARHRYGSFRATDEVLTAWERTREIAEALRARVVVFQCPARFTPTEEHVTNVRLFFSRIARGSFLTAWEPRGDWPDDLVASLCEELNLIHCVDPFTKGTTTREIAYFRLHGRTGYRYRYTDADLRELYRLCQEFKEVWVLFNNVSMWEDALRFRELLSVSSQ